MRKDKPETSLVSQSLTYIEPLPSANELSGYERTLPGAVEHILKMAEREAEHRRSNENTAMKETFKISKKGQWFAFILSLPSLGIIRISMFLGQPLGAVAPTIIAFVSLVAIFVKK
jgi:uncharacterized membrane protein